MRTLTSDGFERAVGFLRTAARPLERALFCMHFEDGAEEDVVAELVRFRNDDGGFGHALEPDVQTPSSSALATGIALRTIAELDCPDADDLVPAAIDFLLGSLDRKTLTWRPVPTDVNEFPHAPWWHDENGSLAQTFNNFLVVPRVLILGSLLSYAALIPQDVLESLTDSIIQTIAELPVLGTGGGSDLEYVAYLASAPGLPQATRDLLTERVAAAVPQTVITDPDKWSDYCLTPLCATPRPTSMGAKTIRSALDAHLDWTIDHQDADGSWAPTWSWAPTSSGIDNYPDAWLVARQAWSGMLTLETLLSLLAFKRL
jgi:hypothetical protein